MREHHVLGAPGCGKTTELVRQIRSAVSRYGYSVTVCSFTKSAAYELASRNIGLPPNRIATLHSFCHRSIGGGVIAEKSPQLEDWNRTHPDIYRVRGDRPTDDDPFRRRGIGQTSLFLDYSINRNRLVPRKQWDFRVRDFAEKWEEWKAENVLVDFTDLIETTLREELPPPLETRVLFADEAQDYSALELAVVRMWGNDCNHFVLAGDDQQCIYGFKGATPYCFLETDLPPENKTILDRSYRLPSVIRDYADRWGRTLSLFEEKQFAPVREGGEVTFLPNVHLKSDRVVELCKEEIAAERTVMVLASCSFMLKPLVTSLRSEGIMFHNPYRITQGAWNPLRGVDRLKRFLRITDDGEYRWRDVWPWFDLLSSKKAKLATGAKSLVHSTAIDDEQGMTLVTDDDFRMLTGIDLPLPDPDWLASNILESKWANVEYGITIVDRYGVDELKKDPKVIVGTIHSVKGGEADTVIVFPDLSNSGVRELMRGVEGRDEIIRLFYVAMTRAKDRLLIGESRTKQFMKLRI